MNSAAADSETVNPLVVDPACRKKEHILII